MSSSLGSLVVTTPSSLTINPLFSFTVSTNYIYNRYLLNLNTEQWLE